MYARPLDLSLGNNLTRALDLGDRYEAAARRLRAAQIECAQILAELALIDGWHSAGAACEADFGERYGTSAKDARMQLGLGLAMKAAPYLEQSVLSGRITVPAAALLGQVLPDPRLQREDDDWVGWAQSESTALFRKRVEKRREEVGLGGEETVGIGLFVRRRDLEHFRRVRVIASRTAGTALTEGQTFGVAMETYLEVHDEARVTPGTRRLPHTLLVDGRYVPTSVWREVVERQGERCAVPFCGHVMFLDKAHLVEHRCGGSREADNLVLLCSEHHFWFDAGYIRIAGTAAKPIFLDPQSRDLTQRFARFDYSPWYSKPDPDAPVITGPSTGRKCAAKPLSASDTPAESDTTSASDERRNQGNQGKQGKQGQQRDAHGAAGGPDPP